MPPSLAQTAFVFLFLGATTHLALGFMSTPTAFTLASRRRIRSRVSVGNGRMVVGMYDQDESAHDSEAFEPAARSDGWRLQRARLEERYQDSFRRRKRIFLPYVDACLWARRMNFNSKEEWEQWIDWGEKRTPYIPSDPEKYYTESGSWKGWDHFLGANRQNHDESFYM